MNKQGRNQCEAGSKQTSASSTETSVTFNRLHSIISQMTELLKRKRMEKVIGLVLKKAITLASESVEAESSWVEIGEARGSGKEEIAVKKQQETLGELVP
jgi:hypothetical protein